MLGNKTETEAVLENEVPQLELCVNLFNGFQIVSGSRVIDEKDIRSDMVTKLLAYMICHRGMNVSLQELSEVLWGDEEIDNPAGALKNLMYRLRNILKKTLGDYNYVITGRGYYKWNEEISVEVDVEQFERACRLAADEKDLKKRIEYEFEADSYYKEKFLPQYIEEYWVVSLNVYYHSLYLEMIKHLAEDLNEDRRFFEMEEVCHSALRIDELDEELHCYLIKALVKEKKLNIASEHYSKTCMLLYDKLGVKPSEKLQDAYNEILKQKHSVQTDIAIVAKELEDTAEMCSGAFICNYGVFKKNFELEVRRAKRQGISVYLVLMTISPKIGFQPGSTAYNNLVGLGVKQMQNVLMSSLRAGDVISRYSVEQFVIMLPECNCDNVKQVMERVMDNYEGLTRKAKVKVSYSLEEVKIA